MTLNSASMYGLLTANLEVQVKGFNGLKLSVCGKQTLAATGAGFTHEEALLYLRRSYPAKDGITHSKLLVYRS
jgi:hypothetical protein